MAHQRPAPSVIGPVSRCLLPWALETASVCRTDASRKPRWSGPAIYQPDLRLCHGTGGRQTLGPESRDPDYRHYAGDRLGHCIQRAIDVRDLVPGPVDDASATESPHSGGASAPNQVRVAALAPARHAPSRPTASIGQEFLVKSETGLGSRIAAAGGRRRFQTGLRVPAPASTSNAAIFCEIGGFYSFSVLDWHDTIHLE